MNLYPRSLRLMTFIALCCEHSGFYQLQKVRALCEVMQSHLCPVMDPILVQPHITRPLPPASSDLGVCPDQTPTLLSTKLTLLSTELTHLLQPFTDTPPPTSPPPTTTFTKQLKVLKQTGFLAVCSHQPSQFVPTPIGVQLSWLCGGPFSLLSVCTHRSLCPRAREQCARTQKEGGGWDLPFPPAPPGGARALCLPTALSGCT